MNDQGVRIAETVERELLCSGVYVHVLNRSRETRPTAPAQILTAVLTLRSEGVQRTMKEGQHDRGTRPTALEDAEHADRRTTPRRRRRRRKEANLSEERSTGGALGVRKRLVKQRPSEKLGKAEGDAREGQARRKPLRRRNTPVRPRGPSGGHKHMMCKCPDAPEGAWVEFKQEIPVRPERRSGAKRQRTKNLVGKSREEYRQTVSVRLQMKPFNGSSARRNPPNCSPTREYRRNFEE